MVRRHAGRSHGPVAGEEAIRGRRDGALPGAHAVPAGDGARHCRARRRAVQLRHDAERRQMPVVEVPIDGAYAPNVFVSVLAVRGRVGVLSGGKTQGAAVTALVDLAQARLQARHRARSSVGWEAASSSTSTRHGRAAQVYHGARQREGERRRSNAPTASAARGQPRSRSPRSTRRCSSSCPTDRWDLLERDDGRARASKSGPRPRRCRWSASGTTAARRSPPAAAADVHGGARAVRHAAAVEGPREARRQRAMRASRCRSTIR